MRIRTLKLNNNMIKVDLLVGGKKYNVTDNIKNWDEIELTAKRKDFGGVIRSFSNKFEFVKNAYSLLEAEYLNNYTKASAVLVVSVLNDSWTYNEKFRCQLDFSSLQSDGYVLSMNAIDNSVASIINANKSQTYDIPVPDLGGKGLFYDRMLLNNKVYFIVIPSGELSESTPDIYPIEFFGNHEFPMGYSDPNFPVKRKIEPFDIGEYAENSLELNPFIKAMADIKVFVVFKFNISLESLPTSEPHYIPRLLFWIVNDKNEKIEYFDIEYFSEPKKKYIIDRSFDLNLKNGYSLKLFFDTGSLQTVKATISNVKEISVSYVARNESLLIDVFTPDKLLTSLLSKMGLSVTGSVEPGNLPIPWMISAESIRGLKEAKVHTSFNKFAEWAKAVLGYEYEITDKEVVFRHLTKFYDTGTVKQLEYVNNLDFSINDGLIFSGVDVGYEKKDYDEINGRDEIHFTSNYSTKININDNVLKLISPYRADCYGIEFLANKREEDTKDDKSDNDIFIVDAKPMFVNPDIPYLGLNRSEQKPVGVLFPDTIFNMNYSPRRMLLANKEHISACTDTLEFTASNGNADVQIEGVSEKATVHIPERMFRIEEVKIDTVGLSPFLPGYKGIISFAYTDRAYQGFVLDITEKTGKAQSTSYVLMCRKIE